LRTPSAAPTAGAGAGAPASAPAVQHPQGTTPAQPSYPIPTPTIPPIPLPAAAAASASIATLGAAPAAGSGRTSGGTGGGGGLVLWHGTLYCHNQHSQPLPVAEVQLTSDKVQLQQLPLWGRLQGHIVCRETLPRQDVMARLVAMKKQQASIRLVTYRVTRALQGLPAIKVSACAATENDYDEALHIIPLNYGGVVGRAQGHP
jgi:hypothetical protein